MHQSEPATGGVVWSQTSPRALAAGAGTTDLFSASTPTFAGSRFGGVMAVVPWHPNKIPIAAKASLQAIGHELRENPRGMRPLASYPRCDGRSGGGGAGGGVLGLLFGGVDQLRASRTPTVCNHAG